MNMRKRYWRFLLRRIAECAIALVSCVASATSPKYVERVTLNFPADSSGVGGDHVRKLSQLVDSATKNCLAAPSSGGVYAIEAVVRANLPGSERLLARARARRTKEALVQLGISDSLLFEGVTTQEALQRRRAVPGGKGIEAALDSVQVELVCDPIGPR
jgi:hypothetical protein